MDWYEWVAAGLGFGFAIGVAESLAHAVFGRVSRLSVDDVLPGRMVRIGGTRWQVLGSSVTVGSGRRLEMEVRLVNHDPAEFSRLVGRGDPDRTSGRPPR